MKMGRPTLINKASSTKDFDFLSVCRDERTKNKNARIVQNKLKDLKEPGVKKVFSDIVQKFDTKLQVRDHVFVISPKRLFVFDRLYNFVDCRELKGLKEIIMIKCNPSVVVLVFAGTGPLLI